MAAHVVYLPSTVRACTAPWCPRSRRLGFLPLAAWSLYRVGQKVSCGEIWAALAEVPRGAILAAIATTIASFAAFILQDYLALKRASRALSLQRAAAGSFIAQSIAHVTGFAILVGGALRARYFLASGLALTSILSVQASFSVSFGLADSLLTGLATLLRPSLASETTHLAGRLAPLRRLRADPGRARRVRAGDVPAPPSPGAALQPRGLAGAHARAADPVLDRRHPVRRGDTCICCCRSGSASAMCRCWPAT